MRTSDPIGPPRRWWQATTDRGLLLGARITRGGISQTHSTSPENDGRLVLSPRRLDETKVSDRQVGSDITVETLIAPESDMR